MPCRNLKERGWAMTAFERTVRRGVCHPAIRAYQAGLRTETNERTLSAGHHILRCCLAAVRHGLQRPSWLQSRRRADYAVLRSGLRLHISGYEVRGDRVTLTVGRRVGGDCGIEPAGGRAGGSVSQSFSGVERAGRALREVDSLGGTAKHGMDENLIAEVIAAESNFDARAVSAKA